MLIGCGAPQPPLALTRAQRSDIDSNMAPLPHSLTSRRSAGGCENVIGWRAEGGGDASREGSGCHSVDPGSGGQAGGGTSQPVCY